MAKVLVVDDDLDNAQTLAYLLKGMGHEVQFSLTAKHGMEVAEKIRPEVVILDLVLPDADGCTLAAEIKKRQANKPRIIAVTGHGSEVLRQRALDSGCDLFLEKPVNPALLDRLLLEH
jgi:DNA-binding response OmpR family regulator